MDDEKFIMLIDDDVDDRYLFSRAAKPYKPGINYVTVESGAEAIALLNNMSTLPRVIFLDLNMPGMNGWDFLHQIKKNEHLKNIPVLIFSTSSHEKDIIASQAAGTIGYCVKPLDFEGLQNILHFVCTHLGPGLAEAIRNNTNIPYFKRLEEQL